MGQYASPYLGMGNNPIMRIDPDGGWDEWLVNLSTNEVTWLSDKGGDAVDFFHVVSNHENEGLLSLATFTMDKNSFGFVSFPQTGDNWGRYGFRDAGGDNWASPETAGAFLRLLHDYGRDFPNDRIYYDDISASDGRDIGHTTHRTGDDIDVRYLGAGNGPNAGNDANCTTCWNTLRAAQGFPFRATNVNFVQRAGRWGFNANYAYPQNFPNTRNRAHYVHRHHLHIGRR